MIILFSLVNRKLCRIFICTF